MLTRLLLLFVLLYTGCIQASSTKKNAGNDASVHHHDTVGSNTLDTEPKVDDTTANIKDTSPPVEDAEQPPKDASTDTADASVDTTTEVIEDTTQKPEDTAEPIEDTAPPIEDTSAPVEDTAEPIEDTAPPIEDTGVDAGPEPVTEFELAEHWAPVFYHDTDDKDYEADYITAFDFDGDFISDNNWKNLHEPVANLGAVIYYSVISTSTHHFILYADFHPRDWSKNCNIPFIGGCHENDMEGAMVVVRRSDDEPMGTFELLYTEAHNILHIFRNDKNITKKWNLHVESTKVTFENKSHPELYVESKGHGVCALYFDGPDHCKHSVDETPPKFGGDDGVIYRYGATAGVPESGNDQHVPYKLKPIKDTLWKRRYDICDSGCTFDTTFKYDGVTLPKAFDGDDYGNDAANPPWAWDDPADGPVYRGDFFFRPAHAMDQHVSMPGPISKIYLVNPFLDDL